MTDEQIIKAVDVCRTGTCKGCPYHELYTASCINKLMEDVFDLINRQKAEIENEIKEIKSEAIKEFAERLKEKADDYVLAEGEFETMIFADDIDNLVKEMKEQEC